MIYVRESEIIYQSNKLKFDSAPKVCPIDGATKRTEMKNLIRELSKRIPKCDERMITALENREHFSLWFDAFKENNEEI